MSKTKIEMPRRDGMPQNCIACNQPLHRKSEHYCSQKCAADFIPKEGDTKLPFLSKWKLRKVKSLKDPSIEVRKKTRTKTNDLIKQGKIKKKPCIVCQSKEVIAHHEDYSRPCSIIWMCEIHHKEYHDGKISLFGGTLNWNPERLTKIKGTNYAPLKKYKTLKENFDKKGKGNFQKDNFSKMPA